MSEEDDGEDGRSTTVTPRRRKRPRIESDSDGDQQSGRGGVRPALSLNGGLFTLPDPDSMRLYEHKQSGESSAHIIIHNQRIIFNVLYTMISELGTRFGDLKQGRSRQPAFSPTALRQIKVE